MDNAEFIQKAAPLNRRKRKARQFRAKKRNEKRQRKGSNTGNISELHPINNTPIQVRAMRYSGTILSTTEIKTIDLYSLLLAVTSGSTSAIRIIEAVKLIKVTCTLLPSSDTNSGTFTFTWFGDREPNLDYTMFYSQGVPSKWTFVPPDDSFAKLWINQDTTTSTLFTLDPDNSTVKLVLDLHFEYIIANGATTTATLTSAATFTGIAAPRMPTASDELTPVGLNAVNI